MSAFERPKSAWKSRSRTPHYTNWEGEPESGRHISVEPPPAISDTSTVARRETVLLADASGSLSDRHHRVGEASREGKAGRQRHPPETKTKPPVEADDSELVTTKKNGRQKKKTLVQDSLDPTKKFEDVSKTVTEEEITRRDSTSVSYAEEIRRLPISTQKREKSWYAAGDMRLKDDPFYDVRITSKELREGGRGVGRGGRGGVGGGSKRLHITAKPNKLAPLSLSRPSEGSILQETTDMRPKSWMPERESEHGSIYVDMGKRPDANRKNKLTPLPGLRKGADTEKQDQHPYYNND